jgi:hypothetical protein
MDEESLHLEVCLVFERGLKVCQFLSKVRRHLCQIFV